MSEGLEKMSEGLEKMPEGLGTIPEGLERVLEGLRKVPEGLGKVPEGLEKVLEGLTKVPEGLEKVPGGLEKASKRKLKILTIQEKVDLILDIEKHPDVKKKDFAIIYGIPSSTLSTILSNKEKIIQQFTKSGSNSQCKKMKICSYPDVEEALLKWFENYSNFHGKIPIKGALLRKKALDFSNLLGHSEFMASNGWLERFKARHNIGFRNSFGETQVVPESFCEDWKNVLPRLTSVYGMSDVFILDETGLFFKCIPNSTTLFKGESCSDGKLSEDRFTILVGANADGSEKLPLLVIGKLKNPWCFRNVKSLPLEYRTNKNAWMTSTLFEEYVRKLDIMFHKKQRKVLLIVDNCPAHTKLENLKSIQLEFLPPSSTSKFQPAEQGIIRNLKVHYRKRLVKMLMNDVEKNGDSTFSVSILDAIRLLFTAWNNDVLQVTIANCFQKCGFFMSCPLPEKSQMQIEESVEIVDALELEMFGDNLHFSEYVSVDDELITCKVLSDEEIIADIKGYDQESTDDDINNDQKPLPTYTGVKDAFSVLQRYIESQENVPAEIFKCFDKLSDFVTKTNMQSKGPNINIMDYLELITE